MAIAFLLEEGEIMNYLQQSNTKESVNFLIIMMKHLLG
ncbi:conserved domain protein [Paenibacillus sp. HGF5]|nr:conserved domain protein [Paenibacillus sp. HGF5]